MNKRWNYQEEHYTAMSIYAFNDESEEIKKLTKKNLKTIGELYDDEQ